MCYITTAGHAQISMLGDLACSQVFERAKKYRPLGAGVGMDVNGMKAIEAIDPALEKWFYDNGWTVPVAKTFDEIGESWHSVFSYPSAFHMQ